MKITLTTLKSLGACDYYLDRFAELFPDQEVELTRERCRQHANDFDWGWAADAFLTQPGRDQYMEVIYGRSADNEARRRYRDQRVAARHKYQQHLTALRKRHGYSSIMDLPMGAAAEWNALRRTLRDELDATLTEWSGYQAELLVTLLERFEANRVALATDGQFIADWHAAEFDQPAESVNAQVHD